MPYKKSEESKKAILDAARRLSEERGYDNTSIRDICAAAGLSTGAFYHYYPSKDALMNESFLHFDNTLTDEAIARYDVMDPIEAAKAVLIDQTRFSENIGAPLMREFYRALLQERGKGAIAGDRLYYRTVRKYIGRAQRAGRLACTPAADDITMFLIKAVRGSLVDWCLRDDSYDVTERTRSELEYLLLPFAAGGQKNN